MPRKRRSVSSEDSDDEFDEARHPQRNAANARERARMRVLSKAFCRLKTTLPWVPADTKLSKLDTLRLATSYIAHLRAVLMDQPPPSDNTHKHPLTLTWPFSFQRPESSPDGTYNESLNAHHTSWVDVPPSQQPVIRDKDKDAANKETEKDLWTQLNKLEDQLKIGTITTLEICKKLKCVFGNEHFNVSTKFVALQGKHQDLCKKINMLEKELNNCKVANTNDIEKLTLQFENRIKQQEQQWKMDIKKIQQQIDIGRANHNRTVQQLYNELDLAQAATALQQDEVEITLGKELVDINVKIRQIKNINDNIRSEIDDLKARQQRALQERENLRTSLCSTEKDFYADQITITTTFQNEEISSFPPNIHIIYEETNAAKKSSTNGNLKANSQSINNNVSKISHSLTKGDMGINNHPLSVSGTKTHFDKFNDKKNIMVFVKPTTTGTVKNVNKLEKSKIKLKDTNKELQNVPKKRRLFDPDNLDYLNNINISQT